MQVMLIDGNIRTTPAMLEFVRDRITHAAGRFAPRVEGVCVSVRDENADKGGIDKTCKIRAVVGRSMIVVTRSAGDYYEAIAKAAQALRRAIQKRHRS